MNNRLLVNIYSKDSNSIPSVVVCLLLTNETDSLSDKRNTSDK